MKKVISILILSIVLFSCSKDDEPTPTPIVQKTYVLKGLFKVSISNVSAPENFLFEEGRVFWGNEGGNIHTTIETGSNLYNNSAPYIFNASTNTIKFDYFGDTWEATYEPTTGKIVNGVVKTQLGQTVKSFSGIKYIPGASGNDLFVGHWKGFYGSGTNTPSSPFSFIIENGTLTVVKTYSNTLTCQNQINTGLSLNAPLINDKTISSIYQYIGSNTFSIQATYNPTTKKLEGTYGSGIAVSGGGTFVMESKNID